MASIRCPFCNGPFVFGTSPFFLGDKTYYIADCFCDNCGVHPPGGKESTSKTGAIISAQNAAKKWFYSLEHEKEEIEAKAYSSGWDDCAEIVLGQIKNNAPILKIKSWLEKMMEPFDEQV